MLITNAYAIEVKGRPIFNSMQPFIKNLWRLFSECLRNDIAFKRKHINVSIEVIHEGMLCYSKSFEVFEAILSIA